MSTRLATRNGKRCKSIGPSVGPADGSLDSSVTVLAIEQSLAGLGIHASLSALLRRLNPSRRELFNRGHASNGSMCVE